MFVFQWHSFIHVSPVWHLHRQILLMNVPYKRQVDEIQSALSSVWVLTEWFLEINYRFEFILSYFWVWLMKICIFWPSSGIWVNFLENDDIIKNHRSSDFSRFCIFLYHRVNFLISIFTKKKTQNTLKLDLNCLKTLTRWLIFVFGSNRADPECVSSMPRVWFEWF